MAAWPRSLKGIVKNFDTLLDRLETITMVKFLFGLFCLTFSLGRAFAGEIIFEGYYRIELSGQHVGYAIQRFEYDAKSKTFEHTAFTRAKLGDKLVQDSLKAKADGKFQPVSYNYTSQANESLKALDATFKGNIMTLKTPQKGGKEIRTETHKLTEGSFLASYLLFVMLQKKLTVNTAFKYSGIAEEEGGGYWGKALIETKEQKGKLTMFRVLNSYRGEEFIVKLAAVPDPDPAQKDKYIKGEAFYTESPTSGLTLRLVAAPTEATEGQMVPNKILTSLFGGMPTGKVNMVANPLKEN
jgi:hypothetical protein